MLLLHYRIRDSGKWGHMKKVNIYVDDETWKSFRMACIEHGTSASKQVEHLMRGQLEAWKTESEKNFQVQSQDQQADRS